MQLVMAAFALGCALLQTMAQLPSFGQLIPIAAIAGALAVLAWHLKAPLGRACGLAGALAAGFAWAATCATVRMADTLPAEVEGRDVDIIGVVDSLPQRFERGVRFEFRREQVLTAGAQVPAQLQLAWYGGYVPESGQPNPVVHAGERWRLVVRLKQPHGGANPHGFDYEAWLLERGIRATGYVRPPRGEARVERLAEFVWSAGGVIDRVRERLRERLLNALRDRAHAGVIVALAIGDQRAIDSDDWQLYQRTGVSHLMSISGLHVTMLASLAAFATFAAWRRSQTLMLKLAAPRAAALAGLAAAFFYCLLAGFAVPAQRTLYMLAVAAWALWRGWFGSGTRVLAIALAVVCVLDPWAPLSAGFWLSFGAVAILMMAGAASGSRQNWLRSALTAQAAVTLGLVPLTLALFQQVSLAGPLANAVAIPLVSFVVTPLALLACIVPIDAIAQAADWVMDVLTAYLAWLGAHPWAVWQRAEPPLWTVVLALAGTLWIMLPWWWHWRILGALWLLPLLLHPPPAPARGDLWITVLDVGQGLAVVLRTASHALVFDAGPQYSPEADGGNRVIIPYLRGEGISVLDALVVSHDDLDHTGGAVSTIRALAPRLLASSLESSHPVNRASPGGRPCNAGEAWTWDNVDFEFLHPPAEDHVDTAARKDNARSCVLAVRAHGRQVLLPADIERDVEQRLVASGAAIESEILIVPHHGSRTSSSAGFLDAVKPAVAVVALGYRNRFRHPSAEVMDRYRERGIPVLRTDAAGAVTLRMEAGATRVETWRSARRRYWQPVP